MKMKMPVPNGDRNRSEAETTLFKLLEYCRSNDWAGYEPYDVLNSKLFSALPFLDSKLPRLVLTQLLKRSPINVRSVLGVPKTQNPKALGLFLSSFVKLSNAGIAGHVAENEHSIDRMVEHLVALRSPNTPYWCWGYNFPWQTRALLVPRWQPNLVCTSFAACGLLDAYEQRHDERLLGMAVSAAEYILNELYWTDGNSVFGFSYPLPSHRPTVHNANFLAAALFCRIYKHTGEEKFVEPAFKAARYSAAQQNANGGWDYGEGAKQKWIDNFHTGFNLGALRTISQCLEINEFDSAIRRGFDFYRAHFFREDGAVRYFHNNTYPIDTHCVAQSIITLLEFKDLDPGNVPLAHSVFRWAMDHMWDDRGFFYYRILRTCTIKTSYMRWTQAWMFFALSMLVSESAEQKPEVAIPEATASVLV